MEIYNIDVRTTMLLLVLGNVFMVGLLLAYRSQQKVPGIYLAACIAQALGWTCLWHRTMLPMSVWYLLGNGLLFGGWILEVVAMLSIDRRSRQLEQAYGLLGALIFAMLVRNWWVDAPLNTLNLHGGLHTIAIFTWPAVFFLRKQDASIFQRVIGSCYALFCCASAWRVAYTLTLTEQTSFMSPSAVHSLLFIALFALLIFSNVGYVLLLKEKADRELVRAATTDALTHVLNRSAFFSHAELAMNLAIRKKIPCSFLMIDIDHFKKINDTYGHPVGDIVLSGFAALLTQNLRPQDVLGRIGGEEFAVFLMCAAQEAVDVAERIRRQTLDQTLESLPQLRYSISIGGFSDVPRSISDMEVMRRRADAQFYRAKNAGRNQVAFE
jgi:diguanylate cyclase (GGDEF)-like protein